METSKLEHKLNKGISKGAVKWPMVMNGEIVRLEEILFLLDSLN